MAVRLPTILPEITTTLSAALPLAIVQADRRFNGWYYENYIQLASMVVRGSVMVLYDRNIYSGRSSPLERVAQPYLPGTRSNGVVDEIVERLYAGYHCVVQLDHYYLRCKRQYAKEHFTHQVLLYGWSESDSVFYAIGFDNRDVISELRFTASEVEEAYRSAFDRLCRPDTHYGMSFLRVAPDFGGYEFRPEKVLQQVRAFLCGQSTEFTDLGTALESGETPPRFGVHVYDDVLWNIDRKISEPDGIRFRVHVPHCLAEHKRLCFTRLSMVVEALAKSRDVGLLREKLEEYRQIMTVFRTMELAYLRATVRNRGSRGVYVEVADVGLFRWLRKTIADAKKEEQRVLEAALGAAA